MLSVGPHNSGPQKKLSLEISQSSDKVSSMKWWFATLAGFGVMRWVSTLIAALSLAGVNDCPVRGQELKKVRIGYPAFSLTFLTFFVAKDAGIFKKNGFDVDLVQLAGAVQTSALVAGEIDYLTGITGPLVAAARGLPFKGIMITRSAAFLGDCQSGNSPRGRPHRKDRGSGPPGNASRYCRQGPDQKKGLNPEKVTFIQTGSVSNSVQALSQGSVAAALLSLPHNVIMTQKGYRDLASATEFNMRAASGGIATREVKLKQEPAQVKAVLRATFETMDFNRREKSWMIGYIQNKWKLTPAVAEEAYRYWLQGLTNDGKIPLKDLQETYDQAYVSQLIPTPVNVRAVMDYTPLDDVLKEKR